VISKSGETEELLNLLPFIKRRKVKLASIVSNPNSRLAKTSDLSMYLPLQKELCPFDLAPTTSTAIQLIFGDILAVALMNKKQFSLEDYILTHPAGAIGKKMTLVVQDLMLKGEQVPISTQEAPLSQAIIELSNKRCGCLLIVDKDSNLEGIFTDGDLRRALQSQGPQVLEKTLGELMTPSAITVDQDHLAWDVLKMMQKDPKKWVMVCPVVSDKKVVGIIRMHDIIQAGLS
jgi:arabinose-5-phosphate isomerase